jgi:ACT domain-containing protein
LKKAILGEYSLKFDLTIAVTDRPGQLVKALEPIAKNGGNIISIIHERNEPVEGYVPVSLVVDFQSKRNFIYTIEDIKETGVPILKSEEIIETTKLTYILIGKLDLKELVRKINENVRVTGFEVSAPTEMDACMKLDLEAPTESIEDIAFKLKNISNEEDLLLISSI